MKNFSFLLLTLLLTSCAQFTRLETGKTIGKDNMRITLMASYFSLDEIDNIQAPYAHLSYEYGIMDKLDVGISVSSALNLLMNAKYQLIGDQDSRFALSVNPGVEFQFTGQEELFFLRPHFSVPMSFDLDDRFSLILEPKYIYQTIDETQFPGFSGGLQVELARDWSIAIGASSFYPLIEGVDETSLFQLGISAKKLIRR